MIRNTYCSNPYNEVDLGFGLMVENYASSILPSFVSSIFYLVRIALLMIPDV